MDLYGINMVHHGEPKTWYCVPPKYGFRLEKLCSELYPQDAQVCSGFMRHKTCMVGPDILERNGIPFNKVVQEERNIIIGTVTVSKLLSLIQGVQTLNGLL